MKRTVYLAGGMLVLGLAIVFATRGNAQGPAPAVAKSKVAMFNLTYVLKNYTKFKTFEEELKAAVTSYQKADTDLRKQLEDLSKEANKPGTTAEARDKMEKQGKDIQRKLEDNKLEGSKVLGKKQGDQLKILYMDVRTAVARYAAAHGYDVVMHYNDAITEADYYSEQNIARKLQAGALMPIYMANGIDVSQDLVRNLNAAMAKPK